MRVLSQLSLLSDPSDISLTENMVPSLLGTGHRDSGREQPFLGLINRISVPKKKPRRCTDHCAYSKATALKGWTLQALKVLMGSLSHLDLTELPHGGQLGEKSMGGRKVNGHEFMRLEQQAES